MKKFAGTTLIVLLSLFILLSIIPYFISISSVSVNADAAFRESTYLNVDGVTLHFRQWTPPAAAIQGKVLLVHGLGGSTFSWRNNTDYLAENGYLVIAVDLPGFGYSDRNPAVDHSQKERSSLLWALLDHIDQELDQNTGDRGWILVGHSMGGGTVSAMTMDKPARTRGLVLVDGAVFDRDANTAGTLVLYPPLQQWIKIFFDRRITDEDRFADYLASAYGREPSESEVDGYLAPLKIDGTADSIIELVKTAKNEPIGNLKNSGVPIVAIWGEDDTWIPLAQAKAIIDMLPETELVIIKGAAHCPMETHDQVFNDQLLQFIRSLPAEN